MKSIFKFFLVGLIVFIGGLNVLMMFNLFEPTLMESNSDIQTSESQTEYDKDREINTSTGFINTSTGFENLIDEFTNTSTLSLQNLELVVLKENSKSGSFTVENPDRYSGLLIRIRNLNPNVSSATVEINGTTYNLSKGKNNITFKTGRTDSFKVNLYREETVYGAAVQAIKIFYIEEND